MNYTDILNNSKVIENYNKIDKINVDSFNHGLKHAKNVCKIMDELCNLLEINSEKKEALLIACALHDIGQVNGRKEHGRKSKKFLISNFESELKSNKYYNDMLNAIEYHDDYCDKDFSLFELLVQFTDKMDFSKERLENNYRDKFKYCCYENIDKVDFIYTDDVFGIDILTSNIGNFCELFLKDSFSKKVINAVEVLAEKLNRKSVILNNGNLINIGKE